MATLSQTLSSDTSWGGIRLGAHLSNETYGDIRFGAALSSATYPPSATSPGVIPLGHSVAAVATATINLVALTQGQVRYALHTDGSTDSYLNTTNTANQQWLNDHVYRIHTFNSFFGSKTSWYPNALNYRDYLAIYNPLHTDHTGAARPDFSMVLSNGAPKTITGMARSGTTVTVTSASHGYANGTWVGIHSVTHTFNIEVNNGFSISNVTANTFDITVSGLSSGSYTSGGKAIRPLYIEWGTVQNHQLPQYHADPGLAAWQSTFLSGCQTDLTNGYLGTFMDDVNLDWRISDGDANTITPYDPRTTATMTLANYQKYMADMAEYLDANLSGEILHNAIWYAASANHDVTNADQQRELSAADIAWIEFGFNDGGLTGGTGIWSVNQVLAYIDAVHALGTNVWVGGYDATLAGCEYNLALYLMASNGADFVSGEYKRFWDDYWPGWNKNLGAATGARTRSTTAGTVGLFRRNFTNGMALALEPGATTVTNYALGGTYYNVAGSPVTTVTLTAGTGKVLTLTP